MKKIQDFNSFILDESLITEEKTLFGDTSEEKLKVIQKWADSKGWKTSIENGSVPDEVRDLWNKFDISNDGDSSKIKVLRIWGKLDGDIPTLSDLIKTMSVNAEIGKTWTSTPIKSIKDKYSKGKAKVQTFSNSASGIITIEAKERNGERDYTNQKYFGPEDFIVFVYVLNDEKKSYSNIDKDLEKKVEDLVSGLDKKQKISIIKYLKNKYTTYSDSI